jgi:hypothetical protein
LSFVKNHTNVTSSLCAFCHAVAQAIRSDFSSWSNHLEFVVDKVTLGQIVLIVFRLSNVCINPPMFRTHSSVYLFPTIQMLAVDVVAK